MKQIKILVADDELKILAMLQKYLTKFNFKVLLAEDGKHAYNIFEQEKPDIIISDLKMPGLDGIELLKKVREVDENIDFIFITAFAATDTAIQALKLGAADYIIKPFKLEELKIIIDRLLEKKALKSENKNLKNEILKNYDLSCIIGKDKKIEDIKKRIIKVLETDATILITGESGTGKELLAKAIHYNSKRCAGPFVCINCAALPETLIESELFGIEKNVATGVNERKGKFEVADSGTIFLDEIGDMPLLVQTKILRVLQEKEFERIGAHKPIKVNIRIIAATNKNLEEEISKGNFREDLFYRLNIFPIHLPSLRERKGDILKIAEYVIEKLSGLKNLLGEKVKEILLKYNWPGNIRELQNAMEYALIMSERKKIKPEHLPEKITGRIMNPKGKKVMELPDSGINFQELEKDLLIQALNKAGGNKSRAAKLLGISRRTFIYRLEKFKIL
jgi:two-component system NtrC family response regulator